MTAFGTEPTISEICFRVAVGIEISRQMLIWSLFAYEQSGQQAKAVHRTYSCNLSIITRYTSKKSLACRLPTVTCCKVSVSVP
jgi:hypothetical protein